MRILYVAPWYKAATRLGGPAVSVSSVAERLVRRGHEVTVCTTNANDGSELDVPVDRPVDIDGVHVWHFRRDHPATGAVKLPYLFGSLGFCHVSNLSAVLERLVPQMDLVHTHMPFNYPTFAAAQVARRCPRPLFYHQRGVFHAAALRNRSFKKRLYLKLIERGIMRCATTLIALTPEEVQSYRALGVATPCRVVSNGVDTLEYSRTTRALARAQLGFGAREKVVLFLGRIHEHKGVDKLVSAFPEVLRSVPEARLIVAGPDEGGLRGRTLESVHVGNRTELAGMVSGAHKRNLLAAADVLCLPSRSEGFSVAILEALASETPVLISPGCHFSEVETAGAGRIVAPEAASLARSLVQMLADPRELRAMGERGRKLAQRYEWDHITDALVDVYEEGLARWQSRRTAAGAVTALVPGRGAVRAS